ncbi:MAG: MMPL family transporter [Firmicutes bacterium]|nr:MMPL family transporter [Bacillota bacterium]
MRVPAHLKNDNEKNTGASGGFFNDKILNFIVYKGKIIETLFIIAFIIFLVCYPMVGVNYDLSKYLPDTSYTKNALDLMQDEFGYPGMARIMVRNVTVERAKELTMEIEKLDEVDLAIGPGTFGNIYLTDEFIDNVFIDEFYKDGNALIQVIFKHGESDLETHEAIDEINRIVGEDAAYSGTAIGNKLRKEAVNKDIKIVIAISVIIIIGILILTTESWVEPFLFILVMVVAIMLNLGSNIFFGEISFFTFSVAAILQLAVSMDYSIFLLHTFTSFKDEGIEIHEAMKLAIKEAGKSILASGATTIGGFAVMALMEFAIGKDIGFVLTKGIILSLVTVLLLMPALILKFNKYIEKTSHRKFMPEFKTLGKIFYKLRFLAIIVVAIIIVPAYVGQNYNKFYFGDGALGPGPGSKLYDDGKAIDEEFGKSNMAIAILPNESLKKEKDLTKEINDLDFVNFGISLSGVIPESVPQDFLPKNLTKELRTDKYSRIIISMNTAEESDYAFECSEKLNDVVRSYYPEDSYVLGLTATTMDIKDILVKDYSFVTIASAIAILIVVIISFKSIFIPLIVMVPIEVAIFVNMVMPYLYGQSLIYIGYIIVSCLQLGATVDYSILITNNYIEMRQTHRKREAAEGTIAKSTLSVITSGGILTVVGYIIYHISTIRGISQVGRLIGRGAIISMILVEILLPALLVLFDRWIIKEKYEDNIEAGEEKNEDFSHPVSVVNNENIGG